MMAPSANAGTQTGSRAVSLLAWAVVLPLVTLGLLYGSGMRGLVDSFGGATSAAVCATPRNTSAAFFDAVHGRRTIYGLEKTLLVSQGRVRAVVEDAMQSVPSAFNSQSNRAVVLFGKDHDKAWDIVSDVLKVHVSEDQWRATEERVAGFKAAAGTVLFFVDTTVVDSYVEKFPTYAALLPAWAAQSDAMLQFAVWTALAAEGLGANLQHYNPLIDGRIADAWDLPASWRLTAQLVFGDRVDAANPPARDKNPVQEKVRVFGLSG